MIFPFLPLYSLKVKSVAHSLSSQESGIVTSGVLIPSTSIDKTYKAINCYRDDDFSVCGAFDDNTELSSGDLALWVADNMEITKHYKIEDNMLKQEGVDY